MPTPPLFVPATPANTHVIAGGVFQDGTTGQLEEERLYEDDQISIVRFVNHWRGAPSPTQDELHFELKTTTSQLWATYLNGLLQLYVDQDLYQIPLTNPRQTLVLATREGNDNIYVDDSVKHTVVISSGAGDDYIAVKGSRCEITSGAGNDTLKIQADSSNIDSGEGNDVVRLIGMGDSAVYTGAGDDTIRGGGGFTFIDAGPGADTIVGGTGKNVLSGGEGNDNIKAGSGTNVIYSGTGNNLITRLKSTDTVYNNGTSQLAAITEQERRALLMEKLQALSIAGLDDILELAAPANPGQINEVPFPTADVGDAGLTVEGTPEFKARVNADLQLLRGSPTARKLLTALVLAADRGGKRVVIRSLGYGSPRFIPSVLPEDDLDRFLGGHPPPPNIRDGQAGPPAYGGSIEYNPASTIGGVPAIVGLYHELCHAYNAVTGTVVSGTTDEVGADGKARPIRNVEWQAIGLPATTDPFDFDLDPLTPPTLTNPVEYSENGIRREMGLPERSRYHSLEKDS